MSNLNISIPHELTAEEALGRIKNLLAKLREEQKSSISNVTEEWSDKAGSFSFKAMGFDLSGIINVNENKVDIDAKLPMAVSFFKGKIKSIIEEKAKALLAK